MSGLADIMTAILPTGTVTTDADGVYRYTLSDNDLRKVRSAILGILPDPSKPSGSGKPLFRVSRLDEAVIPAVLQRYGLYLFAGSAALVFLGRYFARKRA